MRIENKKNFIEVPAPEDDFFSNHSESELSEDEESEYSSSDENEEVKRGGDMWQWLQRVAQRIKEQSGKKKKQLQDYFQRFKNHKKIRSKSQGGRTRKSRFLKW